MKERGKEESHQPFNLFVHVLILHQKNSSTVFDSQSA